MGRELGVPTQEYAGHESAVLAAVHFIISSGDPL